MGIKKEWVDVEIAKLEQEIREGQKVREALSVLFTEPLVTMMVTTTLNPIRRGKEGIVEVPLPENILIKAIF